MVVEHGEQGRLFAKIMSNRSKKNVFSKEANDTLKRVFISPEYRNHMMEIMTGDRPKNGSESLKWSQSNEEYLKIENKYNTRLAEFITGLRYEMAATVEGKIKHDKNDRAVKRDQMIIPEDRFEEYMERKQLVDRDIKQYIRLSNMYNGDERRIINDYIYSAFSVFQKMYGSPLPVKPYIIEDYRILLELYNKHKEDYNLAYPSFPEQYLTRIPTPRP